MKKIFIGLAVLLASSSAFAAKQTVLSTDTGAQTRSKLNANFTELYTADGLKADISCFDSASAFNACFTLDWPTGGITYTAGTGITITDGVIASTVVDTDTFASWDKDYADLINKPTIPDITGLEPSLGNPSVNGYVLSSTTSGVRSWVEMTGGGTGIAHATADGNYYASKDGGWASLTGVFQAPLVADTDYLTPGTASSTYQPIMGADDNYVTDAEKIVIGNTSGVNTGDQDLSGKQDVLVSGTNIKTINSTSLLGSGNIEISGGSMTYPGAGIPNSTGSAWGTSYSLVTTVGATGTDTNIPTEQAVREAINALPNLVFDSATLTVTADTPSAGTDTVAVKANTYQAYDADWLGITANGAALVSAANYAAMRALLDLEAGTDFNAYDADLTTWAGITPGTGVATALGNNTGAVGGLPTVIASGTYTVDTAEIAANTCASAVAVAASGVATTDVIIASPSAILSTVNGFGVSTAGAVRVDVYPTSGNVNFQFCNPTGAAIDPGSVSFNWKVLR